MRMVMRLLFATMGLLFFPLISQATLYPILSLSTGSSILNIHMNQNISLIEPFQNTYVGNDHIVKEVTGLFLGFESPISETMLAQFGFSYAQSQDYLVEGLVYQFADPQMGNLYYEYHIKSQRIFLESKILTTFLDRYMNRYHPFVNIGIGEAINTSNQYTETPVTSADVPMLQPFGDAVSHSFSYLGGIGIELELTNHIRVGTLYRYVNLGRAELSTMPLQQSQETLKNNQLYVNEFLIQFSYAG